MPLLGWLAGGAAGQEELLRWQPSGSPGRYTVAHWKRDWPGCAWEDGVAEGHVSVVQRDGERRLRVDYQVGKIGPESNGCGWRFPIGTREEAELGYTVRFGPGFDWNKGGKLPGLCGGPGKVSGGRPADGKNGFSVRLMWRREGRGEAYVYHRNQPERYGDSFPFPGDFRFPLEEPVRVRLRVTMNDAGKKNGKLMVWIQLMGNRPGEWRELIHRTDLEWRSVPTFAIDSLYFETFHGGSDLSWAPSRPSWAEFSDLAVGWSGSPGEGGK